MPLISEYTARAVFNSRSRGHIGIYFNVGLFSCGYVVRLSGAIRLLRFNSGIAEIDGRSGFSELCHASMGKDSRPLYSDTSIPPIVVPRRCLYGLDSQGSRLLPH